MYTVTFLAHQSGRSRICKWCQDTDHHSGECALEPADKVGSLASPGVELKQNSSKRDKRTRPVSQDILSLEYFVARGNFS